MSNKNLKKRVIEIALIIVISCILFLSCSRGSGNQKIRISKSENLSSSEQVNSNEEKSEGNDAGKSNAVSGEDADREEDKTQTEVYVYVCGEVVNPGLYALPEGARAMDAVTAAGGFTEDAATDIINLAEIETDGSMLRIPSVQEVKNGEIEIPTASGGFSGQNGLIDLNTADVDKLCEIPGIGEAKAKAIIDYRNRNGKFAKTEDLMLVPGIKEGTYEKIRDYIKVN